MTEDGATRLLHDAPENVLVGLRVACGIRRPKTEYVAKLPEEHGVVRPLLPAVAALQPTHERLDGRDRRAVALALSRLPMEARYGRCRWTANLCSAGQRGLRVTPDRGSRFSSKVSKSHIVQSIARSCSTNAGDRPSGRSTSTPQSPRSDVRHTSELRLDDLGFNFGVAA